MKDLKTIAAKMRKLTIKCVGSIGVGHLGGSLSIIELLTILYFKVMNVNPNEPQIQGRDRLIVSKGHAGPAVYAALSIKGYFNQSELLTLNKFNTNLPSHCDMNKTTGIDMTTGSLGQGFSCAVGIAIASKLSKDNAYIYTIIGDGESQEGQIWEAAMYAAHSKLNNLIAFTDYNKLQIDGKVEDINQIADLEAKWKAFNWNVYNVDGHNFEQIYSAVLESKESKNSPSMIILNTIKGKGVSFIENVYADNHNMTISLEQVEQAINEIETSIGGEL